MQQKLLFSGIVFCLLAGCSPSSNEDAAESFSANIAGDGVNLDTPIAEEAAVPNNATDDIAAQTNVPQIAYSYRYTYQTDAADMETLQKAHIKLCEEAGPENCRIINQSINGKSDDYGYGELELAVKANQARSFGDKMDGQAGNIGADKSGYQVRGEDLSKQISDSSAKLRAKELLAERLTAILRTKGGTVSELVEAERALAEVNGEIDTVASWLAQMKGRVAFSAVNIEYNANNPGAGSFSTPISKVWNSAGSTLGSSIAALMIIFVSILPWAMLLGALIWLRRRFKSADRTFWGFQVKEKAVEANQSD